MASILVREGDGHRLWQVDGEEGIGDSFPERTSWVRVRSSLVAVDLEGIFSSKMCGR